MEVDFIISTVIPIRELFPLPSVFYSQELNTAIVIIGTADHWASLTCLIWILPDSEIPHDWIVQSLLVYSQKDRLYVTQIVMV